MVIFHSFLYVYQTFTNPIGVPPFFHRSKTPFLWDDRLGQVTRPKLVTLVDAVADRPLGC